MGDFNLDLLKFETHNDTDAFLNAMLTTNFLPQILQPTRITNHTATLIDNIFLNSNRETFTISGNIMYDLTDHLPNFLIIKNYSCLPNNIKIYKRDFSNFNEAVFIIASSAVISIWHFHSRIASLRRSPQTLSFLAGDLAPEMPYMEMTAEEAIFIKECQSVNWEVVDTFSDVNDMFDSFYTKLSKIIDQYAPIKKIPKKELKLRSKPWITLAIRKSIFVKNKLYKKFLKSKLPYYHLKFKYYRNRLNHLIKVSKKQYYNDYFHANRSNPKKIWTGIKRIIALRPKCNHAPKKINNKNTDITEPKAIANAFNNFFAKIGNDIANSVPNTNFSPQQYLNKQTYDTFYLFPTSTSEIETAISAINVRKATGP